MTYLKLYSIILANWRYCLSNIEVRLFAHRNSSVRRRQGQETRVYVVMMHTICSIHSPLAQGTTLGSQAVGGCWGRSAGKSDTLRAYSSSTCSVGCRCSAACQRPRCFILSFGSIPVSIHHQQRKSGAHGLQQEPKGAAAGSSERGWCRRVCASSKKKASLRGYILPAKLEWSSRPAGFRMEAARALQHWYWIRVP